MKAFRNKTINWKHSKIRKEKKKKAADDEILFLFSCEAKQ